MSSSELRRKIEDADRAFESNFDRQDADDMGPLYTEDGQLLPLGRGCRLRSRRHRRVLAGVFDMGVPNARLETVEVEDHDDTAIEVGRFTLRDAGSEPLDHGTSLIIWKHDDREWKLHRDIWNSNVSDEG